jgi:membrane protein
MSWTICLFGAQLTYTNQNMNRVGIHPEVMDIHPLVDMTDDELSNEAAELYSDRLDDL